MEIEKVSRPVFSGLVCDICGTFYPLDCFPVESFTCHGCISFFKKYSGFVGTTKIKRHRGNVYRIFLPGSKVWFEGDIFYEIDKRFHRPVNWYAELSPTELSPVPAPRNLSKSLSKNSSYECLV